VLIDGDTISYKGETVQNYMTTRMLELVQEGIDIAPWALFMDNLMLNPSKPAREELYQWLEKANMPLTPDGHFLAFKKVRKDYTDCHTGKFDNSPGAFLEMPRKSCDPNRRNHCSTGFHFCSVGYLGSFGGERVMVVKINPYNVTSVPDDYSFTKGRCCSYEVMRELSDQAAAQHGAWKKPVVDLEDPTELPDNILRALAGPKTGKKTVVKPKVTAKPKAKAKGKLTKAKAKKAVEAVTRVAPKGGKSKVEFISNGRTYTKTEIKQALKKAESNRAAARDLGIGESTLRGWKKRIDAA